MEPQAGTEFPAKHARWADARNNVLSLHIRHENKPLSFKISGCVVGMRHTDPRLTAGVYTDEKLLPLAEELTTPPRLSLTILRLTPLPEP